MVWLPTMQSNIDDYKDEMDSVGRFIREYCELDESYSVQSSGIHKDYSAWSFFHTQKSRSRIPPDRLQTRVEIQFCPKINGGTRV